MAKALEALDFDPDAVAADPVAGQPQREVQAAFARSLVAGLHTVGIAGAAVALGSARVFWISQGRRRRAGKPA